MQGQIIQKRGGVDELAAMLNLEFHAVDQSRWQDFELLFESTGGPKTCWCMVWRKGAASSKGPDKKIAMKHYVCEGIPVGLLGYKDGQPVAWCSIAPRATHRDLGGLAETIENVWSLTCLFVVRKLRGEGLAQQLIAAAIGHASENGATVIEAYPVDVDSPSYRFMGFVPMFLGAGFQEVGKAGTRRYVMRKTA